MKLHLRIILFAFMLLASLTVANGAINQFPDWYRMEINFAAPPRINNEMKVSVKLDSILGNLENVMVRLILPEGWQVDSQEKKIELVKPGETKTVEFSVTPSSYLAQGSIVAEASIKVPFQAIEEEIKKKFPDDSIPMIKDLKLWNEVTKRYCEASFALLEEESFYPLGTEMWLNYVPALAPAEGFKGPVFYDDSVITAYQAQTDVEMFEKLINYIKADPELESKLIDSGIDLHKKRLDQLNGLYILAARSFLDKNLNEAKNFIDRLEAETSQLKSGETENLEIAAGNLKAIIFWDLNQKRLAEDSLKKAFYKNRKNPLQRYTLRNISLLMLSNKEKTTAEQMMRLALELKPTYTQLEKEYEKVKNL